MADPGSDGADSCHVVLLGDLTFAFDEELDRLLHCKSNATLQSFFDQVNLAFRHELASLPADQRAWFPRFTRLVDLVASANTSIGAPALRFALLCAYQLGQFIRADSYPGPENSYLLGVCAGAFAAAAISSCQTMSELVPAGVEAVLVAFRTGLHALKTQRQIELSSGEGSSSWAFITSLTEVEAQKVLSQYHAETHLPAMSRLYISAVTSSNVTISGPPRSLDRLIDAGLVKGRPLSIPAPYHAAHLNEPDCVDQVVGHVREERCGHCQPRIPIVSLADGELIAAEDFTGLLRRATEDALCQQVRWDKTCPALSSILSRRQAQKCLVSPVGSNAAHLLCAALRKEDGRSVTVSTSLGASEEDVRAKSVSGKFQDSKIAIVGYSGRFPEAESNEELWEVLMAARDCHRTIPEDRFDWEAHYSTSRKKNCSRVKHGCFINRPGLFDDRFFNISAREAESMDPAQRLALMSTYEAFEMAGLVIDRTPSTQRDRIGVFFGVTSDDWREVNSGQDIDTYFIPGGNRAFLPGRVSYFFRLSGPSIAIDTACSSSFTAITTACNYLWQGECDSAVAGGTNVLTNPDNFTGLDRAHFLSTTGNCNPFDNSASGYCRADAVGSVVLKRLEDAQADGDPIFGVITGASTNHCGQTVSITRPHEGDQLSLFNRILRHTNTDPAKISYVEMHGTGTQAGDAAEMRSVLSAFAPDYRRSQQMPLQPLHLGAVKASVGHSESAAGVTALIKVLMMMKHSEIPPNRVDGELNKNYPADMAERNVHITLQATPWHRNNSSDGTRMAFLNNFSAAGGNTAILLEDAPTPSIISASDPRSFFPVAVTARTTKALKNNISAMIDYLDSNPHTPLPALSYTTTARRSHHRFRVLVSGSDITDIKNGLQRRIDNLPEPIKSRPPGAVFVFTGQGSLYSGMAKQLFHQVGSFQAEILRLERIALQHGFPSFVGLISGEIVGDSIDPVVAHLAMTCVQMALFSLWVCWFGEPSAVVGHSLGEYAALYAASVLSASDTIYLVGKRALLLNQHCLPGTHSMLAVQAPLATIAPRLSNTTCTVACINSPTSVVISGPNADIQALSASLRSDNIRSITLEVPFAFHSAQVEPVLAEFEALAKTVQFHAPKVTYISPLLGKTVKEADSLDASYLARATRDIVNFQGAVEAARDDKTVDDRTVWIEIGIHPACVGMIRQIIGPHAVTAPTLRNNIDTWKVLVDSIETLYQAGAEIQWDEFHREFPAAHSVLPLPSYKWELKNFWIPYRNNFCLTKGDPVMLLPGTAPNPPAKSTSPPSISSSVHRVLEEKRSMEGSTLLVESDLHDPRLTPIVSGHRVNTVELCPSSMYADMALTIAKHMLESSGLFNENLGLDCSAMSIQSPLILQRDLTSQLVRVSAEANWSKKKITLAFSSVDANSRKLADHGTCTVSIVEEHNWLADWKRGAYLISSRIAHLQKAVDSGNADKLKRRLVYKLFGSLVDYSSDYQGMQQVILDSDLLEATAEVKFQVADQGFHINPCWIDSLGGIAGFIMNGSDHGDAKNQVFINHGWGSLRFGKPLESGKTYTTYNRMQLETGTTYVGDTFIFEGEELVGVVEGVRFQGVKRSILDRLLPSAPAKKASSTPTAKPPSSIQFDPNPNNKALPKLTLTPVCGMAPAPRTSRTQPRKFAGALKIIAEEAQMEEGQVDLDAEFMNLGIDSLLSLTILSRLREELDIDASPAAFLEFPTLRAFLNSIESENMSSSSSLHSGASTPALTADKGRSTIASPMASPIASPIESDLPESLGNETMAMVRKAVSENTGIPIEEVSSHSSLTELGLDSLLALTIAGSLSDSSDLQIPSSVFLENDTLSDIEEALYATGILSKSIAPPLIQTLENEFNPTKTTLVMPSPSSEDLKELNAAPHATSVLLQGSSRTAREILFLFPDGAGSATSYQSLPPISRDVAVYGLNCPWLKNPEGLQCSLQHYVGKMLIEIQRIQPNGIYHFGGASAGGILAYEAAQQLAKTGKTVAKLLLIDSPDPVGLENPNQRMYDFLDSMGMFGANGKQTPTWLRPHFDAFLTMLDAYRVEEYMGSSPPQTYLFYARDGMCKHESDPRPEIRPDDPREMLWLLNNRTDFSGAGWNSLLGSSNLHVAVINNVNHYTILRPGSGVHELARNLGRVLIGL